MAINESSIEIDMRSGFFIFKDRKSIIPKFKNGIFYKVIKNGVAELIENKV